MPARIDTTERTHEVVNAVVHLIVTRGLEAVSVRNIAEVARIRPSTLTDHLTNKARILQLSTMIVADRIERDIGGQTFQRGVLAFLPDADHLDERRAWLALAELARSRPDLGLIVNRVSDDRRGLLHRVLEAHPEEPENDALLAVIDGLTAAMCARHEPLALPRAETALRRVCTALGVKAVPGTQ